MYSILNGRWVEDEGGDFERRGRKGFAKSAKENQKKRSKKRKIQSE
jgi:hypothetical protein